MQNAIVLDNGLTLLTESMPEANTLSVGFWVRCGSMHEPAERSGISHFMEHLVFKATATKSSEDIARRIDALGGEVDAFTTKEYTCFYARVLASHTVKAIELLADLVTHPIFREADIEMERGVVLEEIDMVEDTPDDLVHEMFVQSFWRGHPLGRPILGTRETLETLGRKELTEHFERFYHPSNLIVAAAGKLDPAALAKRLEKVFAKSGRDGSAAQSEQSFADTPAFPALIKRIKPELEQVHLCLGAQGVSQRAEGRVAAHLLDTIFGGGMSSRLVQEVREKRGLAYSIYSSLNTYKYGGYEFVYAAANSKNLSNVIQQIAKDIRKLRTTGITRTELVRAKENMRGGIILDLEGSTARMSTLAQQHFYWGDVASLEETLERIAKVTIDEVNELARYMFDPQSLSLALLGDVEAVDLSLEQLCEAVAEPAARRTSAPGPETPGPETATPLLADVRPLTLQVAIPEPQLALAAIAEK